MYNVAKFVAAAVAVLALTTPQTADSAPAFPLVIEGEGCVTMLFSTTCSDFSITLHQDGTAESDDGTTGEWSYNGAQGKLSAFLDDGSSAVGLRNGTCFSGILQQTGLGTVGDWQGCVVQ